MQEYKNRIIGQKKGIIYQGLARTQAGLLASSPGSQERLDKRLAGFYTAKYSIGRGCRHRAITSHPREVHYIHVRTCMLEEKITCWKWSSYIGVTHEQHGQGVWRVFNYSTLITPAHVAGHGSLITLGKSATTSFL